MGKKKFLIDVNSTVDMFACGRHSGIARTTAELVRAIDGVRSEYPDLELELFSQNLKGIGCRNLATGMRGHHLWLRNIGWMKRLAKRWRLREFMSRYDLLHIPHNYDEVPYPERTVVTLHDALFMHISEDRFDHMGMRVYVPEFMRRCRHIITCSEYSKQDIVNTMGVEADKITVIPWGIKHDMFNMNVLKPDDINYPYLLSVSCNAERKRTDKIVDAYLEVWTPEMRQHLVLVWGNMTEWLSKKINNHPAASYIHIERNVSDVRLASLYRGATAMIFVSSFEGFGLPLIEAMACGCPVVTADNSSLHEIGEGATIMLNEPVEDSLRKIIVEIDRGGIDLDVYVEKGLERASLYRWDVAARRTLEVYDSLI